MKKLLLFLFGAFVLSTTGKIVCSQNSDNGTTTINTSGWKAGIYVVAAVVGNQVVETKKIVVK